MPTNSMLRLSFGLGAGGTTPLRPAQPGSVQKSLGRLRTPQLPRGMPSADAELASSCGPGEELVVLKSPLEPL